MSFRTSGTAAKTSAGTPFTRTGRRSRRLRSNSICTTVGNSTCPGHARNLSLSSRDVSFALASLEVEHTELLGANGQDLWACHSASCVDARGERPGGSVLDFVAAMEGCSLRGAAVKLEEWFLTAAQHPVESLRPSTKLGASAVSVWSIRRGEDSGQANRALTFTLKGVDSSHRHLAKRGITNETAAHFGVGNDCLRRTSNGSL